MRIRHLLTGAFAALGLIATSGLASASSHREAPAISNDPTADNTDLWAWTSADRTKLYVVASYIPLEEPAGGPNFHKFGDDVLYEVHVARGPNSLADVVTYQIRFKTAPIARNNVADVGAPAPLYGVGGGKEFFAQISGYFAQTYTVTKIEAGKKPVVVGKDLPVAPPNIGARTQATLKALGAVASATYDDAFIKQNYVKDLASGEGRAFAGPRDDGFYVDLSRIFDLANFAGPGAHTTALDNVAGYNCHTIALEIPTGKVSKNGQVPAAGADNDNTLGVWASASRRKIRILRGNGSETDLGPWVQVSRLGLPLINEAVIGIQDKDKFNRTRPAHDLANFGPYFLNPIVVRDAGAVGILPDAAVQKAKTGRTDIVNTINLKGLSGIGIPDHDIKTVGDVLRVDLGLPSGFPNGRPIPAGQTQENDVTDILLSVLLLTTGDAAAGGFPIKDGVNRNDVPYLAEFPFLALPHDGLTKGHGKPAP